MIIRSSARVIRRSTALVVAARRNPVTNSQICFNPHQPFRIPIVVSRSSFFHTTTAMYAQSPTADALMENLTELYATAKDEFEIAAEETEKKTVYAADDRAGAQEAFKELKEAYEQAVKESDPEVAKEIQGRVGQRIRELQNALTALEESAMED